MIVVRLLRLRISRTKPATVTVRPGAQRPLSLAAGGREPRESQDYGFMYSRSFEDLDGHIWEPMWMDMDAATAAMAEPEPAAA